MPHVTASRTLVKSAPELWTECSDADSLGRHLDGFGDIRITRLEPETTVAWEGEHGRGTVTLEPAGWGTRVVMTATPAPASEVEVVEVVVPVAPEPVAIEPEPVTVEPVAVEPEPVAVEPEPVAVAVEPEPEPEPEPRRPGFFARLFAGFRRPPAAVEVAVRLEATETVDAPTDPVAPQPPSPVITPDPAVPPPEAMRVPPDDPEAALVAALDSLGQAHHRPFSRS